MSLAKFNLVIDIKNDVIKRIKEVIKKFFKKTLDKSKKICYTKVTVKVKTTKGVIICIIWKNLN